MRTSGVASVWLLPPLFALLVVSVCTGSVVRTDTPIEDSSASTPSSADEGNTTEIPEIRPVVDEETTVPPSLEEDMTPSATEQDVQVTEQPATIDVSLDAAKNVESISDDGSSVRTSLEADDQNEKDELASPAVLKSDVVNYSGWTVLKVGGIKDSSDADEPGNDPVEREVHSTADVLLEVPNSEYPLLDLEEHPGVRVLQENRLEGFYEIAVSPTDLESVIDDLTARGFQVENREIDLGSLMIQDTLLSLRQNLLKGEATFDSFMTYEEIENFILAFTEQNPHTVSRQVIGKSVEGRDIHMLILSMGGRQCRSLEDDSSSTEEGSRRESRQIRRNPNSSTPPSVQQALEALTNIIRWGDSRDREVDRKKASMEDQQQGADQAHQEEENGSTVVKPAETAPSLEPAAITATHMLLEKIMQNIPYDYQIDADLEANLSGKDSIKNTYDALQEIMTKDMDQSDDYVFLDSTNQPEAVQLTYKVLQRIINFDPNNPKRGTYKNSAFGEVQNRISKFLKLEDVNSTESVLANANKTSNDASEIEADILFLLSTFLPKEYAMNATIVESVKESLIIISKLLPEDGNLTQEVIDKLAPKIVDLPGVVGVSYSSDGSNSRNELVIRLAHLIRARDEKNKIIHNARSEKDNNESVQMSGCKPVIFLDGGIHAREWISPAFMIYTLTQLVKNTPMILGAEWRVVPVLNPDGYVHTWTKDRLWRKNKATNVGCPGVDLNRNFGYRFGGAGTSTRTCSEIYRGDVAFSEPESQALKAAVEEVKDRVKAYVTVHSYGQMILHPWGYAKTLHPNDEQLKSMGSGMASAIEQVYGTHYVVGSAARILYSAAGGSDDYMASIGIPYSFTLELRDNGKYGFVLPASEIKPTVVETWAAIEYLGNRIINENPQSTSPASAPRVAQAAKSSMFNAVGHPTDIPAPVGVYPFVPLAPLTSEFETISTFSGQEMPMFYSSGVKPMESAMNAATREKNPSAQSSPSQFAQSFNIPQSLQYYSQGNQPLQSYYPFVVAPQGQATQAIQAPVARRPTFSDSLPNVSILKNQQGNVQLTPFGSVGQSSPFDIAFAQNLVSGDAPLLPLYPNAFYSRPTSPSDPQNSFTIQADNVRDGQIVDYLNQVLGSLYRNEALSSSTGSNSAFAPQGTHENYKESYPVPFTAQNPYWNVLMPASTPLRQSVYSGDSSSNPSIDSNSNVFIPYNSPMVVRPTTDFSENKQFPFPSQQFQNPIQNFQNIQPSTIEQFLKPEQNSNSYSSPGGFSAAPQFSQFRPMFSSPARPNFKTDIDQVFRQDQNEHVEEQGLRHRFNAEYHRDSPVLVSLGNPYSEPSPSYSNRFDLAEGEIGELAHIISYPRSLGRQQDGHHLGFEIPREHRQ